MQADQKRTARLVSSSCPDTASALEALQGQPDLQYLYLKGVLHVGTDGATPSAVSAEVSQCWLAGRVDLSHSVSHPDCQSGWDTVLKHGLHDGSR